MMNDARPRRAAERQAADAADRLHARQRRHALEHAAVEQHPRRVREVRTALRIVGLRQPEPRGQHRRRVEAEIDALQPPETLDQQRRADEQHERERELADDEDAAQAGWRVRRRWPSASPRASPTADRRASLESPAPGRRGRRSAIDRPAVNASTVPLTPTACRRGRLDGLSCTSASTPQTATSRPSAPPTAASSTLSVSSCRTRRARPAPSARRIAISRWRTDERASSRFATFAQAISSTQPTAASSVSSAGRTSPTRSSCSGMTRSAQPVPAG